MEAEAEATVQINRNDAEVILKLMGEPFLRRQLSSEEAAAMHNLCRALGVGRPVPEHGSGP